MRVERGEQRSESTRMESREVNQHAWRAKRARPVICALNTHAQRAYSQSIRKEKVTQLHITHRWLAWRRNGTAQCLQLKKPAVLAWLWQIMLLSTMYSDAIMQRCIVRLCAMMLHMCDRPMLANAGQGAGHLCWRWRNTGYRIVRPLPLRL
jgi:hypothetical protein